MVQQLAAAMLDLATEGEDEDDEGDQTVYCCACSVIDALARNAPARVMWPLVKDFTSSKVHAPLTFNNQKSVLTPLQAVSADIFDRRGALAVLRSTVEGLSESMRPSAEALVRCALQGLSDPDPRVVNEGLICIGELAENLSPDSLTRTHGDVLSALLLLVQPNAPDKIAKHTLIALEQVLESLPAPTFAPHIPSLIARFHALLDPSCPISRTPPPKKKIITDFVLLFTT